MDFLDLADSAFLMRVLQPYLGRVWWVAYSGGVDSCVLLHVLCRLRDEGRLGDSFVKAVHVNHQLQEDAPLFVLQCREVCEGLGVELEVVDVTVRHVDDVGIEAAAREVRYEAFESLIGQGDCLLMAHQQDDQVETVLMRLLRGSGVGGLAGIDAVRVLGNGVLLRPLLSVTRRAIEDYAQAYSLKWCEDASNQSEKFDRNFLRHRVLPLLNERWPGFQSAVVRSARHCREYAELVDVQTERLLGQCSDESFERLKCSVVRLLNVVWQRMVFRAWIRQRLERLGLALHLPSEGQLSVLLDSFVLARNDAAPLFETRLYQIRRYRDKLYLMAKPFEVGPFAAQDVSASDLLEKSLLIKGLLQKLNVDFVVGQGVKKKAFLSAKLIEVRFRQGGERISLDGKIHRQLKHLFQESAVPPWMRDRTPLIYFDGQLIVVVGLWIAQCVRAVDGDDGIEFRLVD